METDMEQGGYTAGPIFVLFEICREERYNEKGLGLERMNYTYILRCRDKSLYTGWTNDIEKRLREHNEGRGAKYTRGRTPVELVYYEAFDTKEEAMKREYAIKHMSRSQKEKLILK